MHARGFTLVETLVAISITAVALTALAQLFIIATEANADARRTTFASILATEKIEQLRSLGADLAPQGDAFLERRHCRRVRLSRRVRTIARHGFKPAVGDRLHSPLVRRADTVGSGHICFAGGCFSASLERGGRSSRFRRAALRWRSDCHRQNAEGRMIRLRLRPGERGFSLIELLVAVSLMLIVMSSVFQTLNPVHGAFRAEPETADLQQRLRVAADALSSDLRGAGGGLDQGVTAGPLTDFLAPILPMRQGRRNADPAGTFKTAAITLLAVDAGAAQTTIAQPLVAASSTVLVNRDPGCPPVDPNCGFRAGMSVVVFDDTGAYDTFTVTSVDAAGLHLQHNMRDSTKTYAANACADRSGHEPHVLLEVGPGLEHVSADAVRRRRGGRCAGRRSCRRVVVSIFWRSSAAHDPPPTYGRTWSVDDVRAETAGVRGQLCVRRQWNADAHASARRARRRHGAGASWHARR